MYGPLLNRGGRRGGRLFSRPTGAGPLQPRQPPSLPTAPHLQEVSEAEVEKIQGTEEEEKVRALELLHLHRGITNSSSPNPSLQALGAIVDTFQDDSEVEAWYSAFDDEGDKEFQVGAWQNARYWPQADVPSIPFQSQERVIQIRRVTKVVKGGKQLSFRAVVIIGDEQGTVGVGVASAKEVVAAVSKAVVDAKRNLVTLPISRTQSIPHRVEGRSGASKVLLRPAGDGTGVVAGGATRVVLELAGLKNIFGKQLGAASPLNNARATVEGLRVSDSTLCGKG